MISIYIGNSEVVCWYTRFVHIKYKYTIHDYKYSYDIQCIINVIAHGFYGIIANYKCMQISQVIIFEVL